MRAVLDSSKLWLAVRMAEPTSWRGLTSWRRGGAGAGDGDVADLVDGQRRRVGEDLKPVL